MMPEIFALLLIISAIGLLIGFFFRNAPLAILGAGLLIFCGVVLQGVGIDREMGLIKTTLDENTTQLDYNFVAVKAADDYGLNILSLLFAFGGIAALVSVFVLIRLGGG